MAKVTSKYQVRVIDPFLRKAVTFACAKTLQIRVVNAS